MDFFDEGAEKGRKQEEMKKASSEVSALIERREKLRRELNTTEIYQKESLKIADKMMNDFKSFFEEKRYTVESVDPGVEKLRLEAASGNYKYTLTHLQDDRLDFKARGFGETLNFIDTRILNLNFSGYYHSGRDLFINNEDKFVQTPEEMQNIISDLKQDLKTLSSLIEQSYIPQLKLADKDAHAFGNFIEYLRDKENEIREGFRVSK